ncbi:MAG: exonuclease domain-containing protein, partial [Actinomycetota bacterium]|nr:exonuclease domain-containing protein [Actinomycetota bacterium]
MPSPALPFQPSLADLGAPLHDVTFVVVDLETTGGSPRDSRITEFGAVKVRAGEVLGEFQSLVDPGQAIPAAVSALTGITDAMVAARPGVAAVLPTFLEFCGGAALVAHNARFDVGFLQAALDRLAYP